MEPKVLASAVSRADLAANAEAAVSLRKSVQAPLALGPDMISGTSSGEPPSLDVDGPFWNGLANDELLVQRCARCRIWTWPPRWRCGECGSWRLDWQGVPKRGRVHSFCQTVHVFRPGMHDATPYTTLLVALEGAVGVRLLGLLVGSDSGVAIDAPVEGVIDLMGALPVLRWRLSAPLLDGLAFE
jgi:uncharacterized protein